MRQSSRINIKEKKTKIMKNWELSFGFVPGFLVGIRSYPTPTMTNHVLYILFIDICLTIFEEEESE
jgi:hypothetical protein